ncbi:MAG: ABC transporter permease [Lentisphaeria bacterium]|nr:ABC transporter permease [Lentisphaeria bacterium]
MSATLVRYIIRRTEYSVLIIAGVVFFTFVLFNLCSGDPAAAVLGKNARPEEIESLRRELGSDLPLLFGRKCRTEAFPAWQGDSAAIRIKRNFPAEKGVAVIRCKRSGRRELPIDGKTWEIRFSAPPGDRVVSAEFFRFQRSPFNSQFLRAVKEILTLDFGRTVTTRERIGDIFKRSVGPSLMLMLPVFLGELSLGVFLALVATAFRNRLPDRLLVLISVAGMSLSYLTAIILGQWFLGYYLELFPIWGFGSVTDLGLPVTIGILCGTGTNVRFFRTVFSDELRREYLRTAAAKGASPARIYGRHLLRNGAIQIITRAGASLPFLFTGSLLLESFFGIPGLGFAGVDALYNSDIQLLKALVVFSSFLFVVINLLTDLAYAWADPRIRLE